MTDRNRRPLTNTDPPPTRPRDGGGRVSLRHFVEMCVAMYVGMLLLGPPVRAAASLFGVASSAQEPAVHLLEMAIAMAIGMMVWMRLRGHGWASTLEMAGVMFLPAAVLVPLLWGGRITGPSALAAEHVLMLPLMYLVMRRRSHDHARGAPAGSGALRALKRRWPTVLGIVSAYVVLDGASPRYAVDGFGELLLLLPLVYLAVAALQRRHAAWPMLVAGFVTMVILQLQQVIAPATALVAAGAAVLVVSVLGHGRHRSGPFRVQAVGMVLFGVIAIVGLALDPEFGRHLVGAGWLLHGIWDLVHLRRDEVVSRSYAEWCGVLDAFVGTYLILA